MSQLAEPIKMDRPVGRPLIVAVGASAGGLEAFTELLSHLPDDPGFAIVLVQHLDPNNKSLLADLLRNRTTLPVKEISRPITIATNTIYLCPPRGRLQIDDNQLVVATPANRDDECNVIDHFFHSVAGARGQHGIGVVLSGSGSDGTLGLKSISDAGGMTFAQDARSAKFDSMPRNAATTGVADRVMTPAAIATELVNYARYLDRLDRPPAGKLDDNIKAAIPQIAEALLSESGHDFKHYKISTLVRRIHRRMQILKLNDVDCYVTSLQTDPAESQQLFRELLISVTAFFRDPASFDSLATEAIPQLFAGRGADDPVRIWVPGCATGEEAYTIAMLCHEHARTIDSPPTFQIFASDIDERALSIARAAAYPVGIADQISSDRLQRYFVKRGKRYHVRDELRQAVLFSPHNLISDPPFSRLDLISCRNLLIYLGPHLQKKLIPLFHFALRPGGFLMLGPSESISTHGELFAVVDSRHRISRRKGTAIGRGVAWTIQNPGGGGRLPEPSTVDDDKHDVVQIMQRIVLDEFAPKSVVVDESGQVVCASGETNKYLSIGEGAYQNNLLKMARRGLRIGLRATLSEAKAKRRRIIHENLSVQTERGKQRVMITVQPMMRLGEPSGLFLVVFHDVGLPIQTAEVDSNLSHAEQPKVLASSAKNYDEIIEQLERELATTREDLEKTMQEMETTNEELKSSNEELLSMNEELQSTNEELETSKEEIRSGSEAVRRVNADLENLLRSTRIATIFLDEEGLIRSFTPAATEIYSLIPTDIGRPLDRFVPAVQSMPPLPDAATLQRQTIIEDTVFAHDGRAFIRRVMPYQSHTGQTRGTVVTFTDVTELKQSQLQLEARERQLQTFTDTVPPLMAIVDRDQRFTFVNRAYAEHWQLPVEQIIGHRIEDVVTAEAYTQIQPHMILALAGDRVEYELALQHSGTGQAIYEEVIYVPQQDPSGEVEAVHVVVSDITERKLISIELTNREAYLRRIIDGTLCFVGVLDSRGTLLEVNRLALQATGLKHEDVVGVPFWETGWWNFDPAVAEEIRDMVDRAAAGEMVRRDTYYAVAGSDPRPVDFSLNPIRDDDGQIRYLVPSGVDIGDRVEAEQQLRKARRVAETASASKSAFVANMSHEIRTPMTAILGYAEMLRERVSDEQSRDYLRTIRRNGDYLLEIINDILDLSKIEAGKMDMDTERFEPARVVEDVRSIMSVRAGEANIDLNVDYATAIPKFIQNDPKRLKQILINLVGNAVKFTKRGGVVIKVAFPGQSSVGNVAKAGQLQFSVIDTGIGMTPGQRERLFKPFSQGDSMITQQFGGTGLGLAISQRLAAMLGGKIICDTELGRGSTFTATIDANLESLDADQVDWITPGSVCTERAVVEPTGDLIRLNAHILIVDDRRDIRFLSKHILGQSGATIVEAEDGVIAIETVRRSMGDGTSFDLILLDMQMPNLDGYETAAGLRNLGYTGPIIALTADAMQGDMNRCLQAGCNDYLSKPIDRIAMLQKVAQMTTPTA